MAEQWLSRLAADGEAGGGGWISLHKWDSGVPHWRHAETEVAQKESARERCEQSAHDVAVLLTQHCMVK